MRKAGYDKSLAAGTVASCANLSSMIPPSGLMIIYSIFTEQSLGELFMAGILPGILLAILFSAYLYISVSLKPELAPRTGESASWRSRFVSLRHGWGIFLVGTVVLGGIYLGVFTPTESGAAGAFITFILSLITRGLSWTSFKAVLLSALKTTVMVLFIVVGIMVFTQFLALSRVPIVMSAFLKGLPIGPLAILCAILVFYLILGMFFDAISMIALTIPVLFPTVIALGYDPIWFGVIVVLMCEVGLISPPVGVNCYVISGVLPDISLQEVFKGTYPFVLIDLVAAAILIAFPKIALFLPGLMSH
jgi:C4-dicarboxylate transporter DctM subunit